MKKIILFILFCAHFVQILAASDTGKTGGTFLKIPIGSRMVGMGEAYTSVADDPYALFGNVAGIAKKRDLEISFSHVEWFGDVDYEFLGFTKSFFNGFLGQPSTIGFSLNYLHMPFFNSYDDWGDVITDKVTYNDYALTLGYAQNILNDLKAGISVRYISEVLDTITDNAMTMNIGLLYSYRVPGFTLFGKKFLGRVLDCGLLMENWSMGSDLGGYGTPVIFKLGLSFNLFEPLLTSVDIHIPMDNRIRINAGCEYGLLNDRLFVRAGYRFLGYEVDSYTIGLGGRFNMDGKIVKVDLSYAPLAMLGNTINLSFSIKFPGKISDEKRTLAETLYYKGIYYFVNEDYPKAIELWNEALINNPGMDKAKEKIKETTILMQLKKIEDATPDKYKKEYYKEQNKNK